MRKDEKIENKLVPNMKGKCKTMTVTLQKCETEGSDGKEIKKHIKQIYILYFHEMVILSGSKLR